MELNLIQETELPLTKPENLFRENDKLDLNNSDLIACTIHMKERRDRRFLVIDQMQFILIEPDVKKVGWGIVKFCDLMQDVEVVNDKEDSRSLHITIHKPVNNIYVKTSPPILNAKFTFDDHIRCMTAKQNLIKGRQRARQIKLSKIASILEIETIAKNMITQTRILPATTYSQQHQLGFTIPALPNHPGRAALISGPKQQPVTQTIPITNRAISLTSTSASSPSFSNVEHTRSYSLSRAYSDQPSHTSSGSSTPTTTRRTSISDTNEKSRRSHSQMNKGPKSLREWHEKPVNLLEQPFLLEKFNVQILSPNSERTYAPFFRNNNLANDKSKSDDNLNTQN